MRCAGYTLIEIVAVLALMAIAAGAVGWTMSDAHAAANLDDAINRIRSVDRQARSVARRFDRPVTLRFDLEGQTVRRVDDANASGHTTSLSAGHRIEAIKTRLEPYDPTQIDIAIGRRGFGESYAIHLRALGRDAEDTWVVVAGSTGQMTRVADEQIVDNLLHLLPGPGAGAGAGGFDGP